MSMIRRTVLAAGVALAAAAALAGCSQSDAATGDMAVGKADAPVTVIEYASVTCSHCATFNEEVYPAFKAKYVDTGQVRYVLREFLTAPAEVAAAGFLTARCAGDDKYFAVVDSIFRAQPEMFRTQDWRGTLLRVAQSAGLTETQFNACINDADAIKALNARVEQGIKDGVDATPYFLVNGKPLAAGEKTLAQLDAAIAEAKR